MDEQTDDALHAIVQEPDDLDGHTIDELADYLDSGRTPPDPAIESSAACRHALAALERLRHLADLESLAAREERDDDAWVDRIMGQIALDAHAGADFTLATSTADTHLVMTEGALRALVRAAGDDQPEFLVGRVRFTGDLSSPTTPVTIAVNVTVLHGVVIPTAVERLRTAVRDAVTRHTAHQQLTIDITVQDLDVPAQDPA